MWESINAWFEAPLSNGLFIVGIFILAYGIHGYTREIQEQIGQLYELVKSLKQPPTIHDDDF